MVMGTLANLYAIQQSFSTAEKDIVEAKKIIDTDLIANKLAKQQLIDKSMYTFIYYIYICQVPRFRKLFVYFIYYNHNKNELQ